VSLDIARAALSFWQLDDADIFLFAERENQVYQVSRGDGRRFAMRVHRPGYQSTTAIQSELQWMSHLHQGGIEVPEPLPSNTGACLVELHGYHIDMLSWLSGYPLGKAGELLTLTDRTGTFRRLGELMAKVHELSDAWTPPAGFERMAWDVDGLLGEHPVWGRFWENPYVGDSLRRGLSEARHKARQQLDVIAGKLDYGLIHADMIRENVLIAEHGLQLIDFDDCGYGFRLFDVCTSLIKNHREPDSAALQGAFIEGYHSVRELDLTQMKLFMLLRAFTYIGWIVPRMNEPGAAERLALSAELVEQLTDIFLAET
jgi:Ser/Thr protein kinase RdoA (MazF antagonist)